MAQKSWPWAGEVTGDCGPYSSSDTAKWNWLYSMTNMGAEGVLRSDGSFDSNLNATGTASPISIGTGRGAVRGRLYYNDASVNFTIATPSSATRNDLIILQVDYVAATVRLAKLQGSEGGGDPSLTQIDGTKWEVPIWRVTITTGGAITLTDLRVYCHFRTSVCTAQLDDDVLSADSVGRKKIEDGYFAATSEMRAKFANDFITKDMCQPSVSPMFAWCSFNGQTMQFIDSGYGVDSISKISGGKYRIYWESAQPTTAYMVVCMADEHWAGGAHPESTTNGKVYTSYGGSCCDCTQIYVCAFRGEY